MIDLRRYALGATAMVAMLAGCGGSNTALNPTSGRVSAERTRPRVTYGVLHSFGGSGDGQLPFADLLNVKGTLYGTTVDGGADDDGTVFAITMSGTETVLYSFKGGVGDGESPYASLSNVKGMLYGATDGGGTHDKGTIFATTTSGAETVLHGFGQSDGKKPYGSLINVDGTLYGTTTSGGADDQGTVFSITTSGKRVVLHSFGRFDGAHPYASLINVKGTLYGTTYDGGANGYGTIFSITTSGTETVLYSFTGGSGDGAHPYAGLLNVNGTLYGTTYAGGANSDGTVFALTTTGTETVLYSFKGGLGDGQWPFASLLNVKSTLYGTTYGGGADDQGTVFALTTSGKETVLHQFQGHPDDGARPYPSLINVKGTLYGTTYAGGADDQGTVFSLTP